MKKHTVPKSRAKKLTELKKQALKRHPGVKELMEVYNHWREIHKVEQVHQAMKNPGHKGIYSNSSDPKSFL